jgi:hypothetical protein
LGSAGPSATQIPFGTARADVSQQIVQRGQRGRLFAAGFGRHSRFWQ